MPNITLNATWLRRIAGFASNDKHFPVMRGVAIQPTPTGVVMIATDSYVLGAWHDGLATHDEKNPQIMTVSKELVSAIKAAEKNKTKNPHVLWDGAKAEVYVGSQWQATAAAPMIPGEYPQWRDYVPEISDTFPGEYFALDPDLLKAFAFDRKHTALSLNGTDLTSPMIVSIDPLISGASQFLGLLLPLTARTKPFIPKWFEERHHESV